MSKISKTNAMRILRQEGIEYDIHTYDTADGKNDGPSVAAKIGRKPAEVYKTLVAQGGSRELYVFVIPVSLELNLKKAAAAAGEKKIEMIPVKNLLPATGYIKGGCSPVGMKKQYRTFIDTSSELLEKIIVSGGKIGIQIELSLEALHKLTGSLSTELC